MQMVYAGLVAIALLGACLLRHRLRECFTESTRAAPSKRAVRAVLADKARKVTAHALAERDEDSASTE